jgi:hypothetical protein
MGGDGSREKIDGDGPGETEADITSRWFRQRGHQSHQHNKDVIGRVVYDAVADKHLGDHWRSGWR